MHQTCPICAWINPETNEDAGNKAIDPATVRMLKHLLEVHYEPGSSHQPWENKVFTKVRIEE
jgi:hypothetical protein